MATEWFTKQINLNGIGSPIKGSVLIDTYETPFVIKRTQIWVFTGALLDADTITGGTFPGPQGWSFRESGSDINPGFPNDAGTWAGGGEHYLATGVTPMEPAPYAYLTDATGHIDIVGLTGQDTTDVYTAQHLSYWQGKSFVDSHAQRKCSTGFVFASFCVQGNGITSDTFSGQTYTMQAWFRILLEKN